MVGDPGPGGGIVFYVAESRQRWGTYLEASPAGVELDALWCKNLPQKLAAGTDEQIGSGAANTKVGASACPEGAAAVAASYEAGGLQDWFLPSIQELIALDSPTLKRFAPALSLQEGQYWSSSIHRKQNSNSAWSALLPEGNIKLDLTNEVLKVRPIRAF
jgi:hypothetical protein